MKEVYGSLFLDDQSDFNRTAMIKNSKGIIEKIRAELSPDQFKLIPARITLCREDEIKPIEKIIERIQSIQLEKPNRIALNGA